MSTVAPTRTYRVSIPERPTSFNVLLRSHRMVVAQTTTLWRSLGRAYAINAHLPKMERVSVTVQSRIKGRRSHDVLAEAVCVKAALDGLLVDSRVLVDDDAEHLVGVMFLPPELGCDSDALVLDIEALS